jgi:hypothetical protein
VGCVKMRKYGFVKEFVVHAANLRPSNSGLNGLPLLDRWDLSPRVTN